MVWLHSTYIHTFLKHKPPTTCGVIYGGVRGINDTKLWGCSPGSRVLRLIVAGIDALSLFLYIKKRHKTVGL